MTDVGERNVVGGRDSTAASLSHAQLAGLAERIAVGDGSGGLGFAHARRHVHGQVERHDSEHDEHKVGGQRYGPVLVGQVGEMLACKLGHVGDERVDDERHRGRDEQEEAVHGSLGLRRRRVLERFCLHLLLTFQDDEEKKSTRISEHAFSDTAKH